MNDVIKLHVKSRMKDWNKFKVFCSKNETMPYQFKNKVLMAAIISSLLYGCESWLEEKVSTELESLYMKGIKCLLGVRSQTPTDVVLLESGYPSLRALIKSQQKSFLEKAIKERENMLDDPLMHVIRLTRLKNPKMSAYLTSLTNCDDFIKADRVARMERVRSSAQTKPATYFMINPTFEIHPVYQNCDEVVADYLRVAFTRFRTSSHRLKVETGRWSRLPRERRLCKCGAGIQTEQHVLIDYELAEPMKEKYGFSVNCFNTFMSTSKSEKQLQMLHEILNFFED